MWGVGPSNGSRAPTAFFSHVCGPLEDAIGALFVLVTIEVAGFLLGFEGCAGVFQEERVESASLCGN